MITGMHSFCDFSTVITQDLHSLETVCMWNVNEQTIACLFGCKMRQFYLTFETHLPKLSRSKVEKLSLWDDKLVVEHNWISANVHFDDFLKSSTHWTTHPRDSFSSISWHCSYILRICWKHCSASSESFYKSGRFIPKVCPCRNRSCL